MLPDLERQYELFPENSYRTTGRLDGTEYDLDPGIRVREYPYAFIVDEDNVGVVPVNFQQAPHQAPDVGLRTPDLTRQQVERIYSDTHVFPLSLRSSCEVDP